MRLELEWKVRFDSNGTVTVTRVDGGEELGRTDELIEAGDLRVFTEESLRERDEKVIRETRLAIHTIITDEIRQHAADLSTNNDWGDLSRAIAEAVAELVDPDDERERIWDL